ncbi:hypothetical protein SARC_05768 [Sphaeroforma arctica JP610]|uniref:Uncharacterized protein n=1 Tax=Sphaeroforma arctica JP610 TaxID=667725 RepID=A0A0L0FZ77_9EUKA|nr:hypothetical protein SARC_05768 [Sphaeroforma arctica JP610]KNC81939.1 hypothetical protein SARC_05768 [Sphaeroforma arctica JP610]|eukprot:XP_014155841.1 hypothetical protein SARC_05768 [Sphaeroforma arctica JP610]
MVYLICFIVPELGAEVIKIEAPRGDPFRDTLLTFEKPRKHSTIFEASNFGKLSLELDVKQAKDVEKLLKLLETADVLVTNTRPSALKRLGLDYDTIKDNFPHIVYAQVSAWGFEGPDAELAGYDIGAFFSGTGVSTSMQEAGYYSAYVGGFGDLTAGQSLMSGVSMGLANRIKTGRGIFTSTTLLRNGLWCISPHIARASGRADVIRDGDVPDYERKPESHALDRYYRTKDARSIMLSSAGRDSQYSADLINAFKELVQVLLTNGANAESENVGEVLQRVEEGGGILTRVILIDLFEAVDCHAITELFVQHGVDCEIAEPVLKIAELKPGSRAGVETVYQYFEGTHMEDCGGMSKAMKVPYTFSCSDKHRIQNRAPLKGQHTQTLLAHGWSDVHEKARLPISEPGIVREKKAQAVVNTRARDARRDSGFVSGDDILYDEEAGLHTDNPAVPTNWGQSVDHMDLLHDGVVVELCTASRHVHVSGATCMMADFGATVVKVECSAADSETAQRGGANGPWPFSLRDEDPLTFAQVNRGKKSVALDLERAADQQRLAGLLATASIFITDYSATDLERLSISPTQLRQTSPQLIVVHVTPYPEEDPRSTNSYLSSGTALYAASGLSSLFSGRTEKVHHQPAPYMLDLLASQFVLSATMAALFHSVRTGEGQIVATNLWHIGCWLGTVPNVWMDFNREWADMVMYDPASVRYDCPLATFQAYKTKDGMWVELLGLDTKRHLPIALRALGIRLPVFGSVLWAAIAKVLPNRKEKVLLHRVKPIFAAINKSLETAILTYEWHDLHTLFLKHDVWHNPVRIPEQLLTYSQAHAIGSYVHNRDDSSQLFVATPLNMSSKVEHATYKCQHIAPVPKLGEHTDVFLTPTSGV